MASSRKAKRKEQELPTVPTKQEYSVAKFLRFNVPTREGNLPGVGDVSCFYADDAVNALLDSKWAKGKECLFTDRKSCVDYCKRLLHHGLFVRAKLAKKPDKPPRGGAAARAALAVAAPEGRDSGTESGRRGKGSQAGHGRDSGTEGPKEQSSRKKRQAAAAKKDDEKEEIANAAKKKLKKLKLEVQEGLPFVDGREWCVWVYDPTSFKTFAGGLLLILGAIAFCLYPLWPQEMRGGTYYLSIAAIGLLALVLLVTLLRGIIFVFVWAVTAGNSHLWVLPNLWQDCGFLESFKPFYSVERKSDSSKAADGGGAGGDDAGSSDDTGQAAVEDEAGAGDGEPVSSGEENGTLRKPPGGDTSGRSADNSSSGEDNGDQDFEIVDAAAIDGGGPEALSE